MLKNLNNFIKVTKVIYWWDGQSRNWIVQALDEADAAYAANRKTLPGVLKGFEDFYGVKAVRLKETV